MMQKIKGHRLFSHNLSSTKYWIKRDGECIAVEKLTEPHLRSIIKMYEDEAIKYLKSITLIHTTYLHPKNIQAFLEFHVPAWKALKEREAELDARFGYISTPYNFGYEIYKQSQGRVHRPIQQQSQFNWDKIGIESKGAFDTSIMGTGKENRKAAMRARATLKIQNAMILLADARDLMKEADKL